MSSTAVTISFVYVTPSTKPDVVGTLSRENLYWMRASVSSLVYESVAFEIALW